MECNNKLCKYNDDYYRDNCSNTLHAELASQCMKNNFNHYDPADLAQPGASAQHISSVMHSNATRWIKVSEMFPELGVPVLMRVTCGSRFNVEEGKYKGGSEWANCWCSIRNENLYPVTHWMPLPDAPEV